MRPNLPNVQNGPLDSSGRWLPQWVQFLRGLVGEAGAMMAVPIDASPMAAIAPDDGHYLVTGGAGVGISLQRGRQSRGTGMSGGLVPVARGDSLILTYSAAPAVTFIPS